MHIPDLHAPFIHRHAYRHLRWVYKKYNCERVVCAGDEADEHALGNWDHDPDGFSAGYEHAEALHVLKDLYRMFPNVEVCISNHTSRVYRKAYSAGIPKAFIRDYRDFMKAPIGWQWKKRFIINNVLYMHGEKFSGQGGALKAAMTNRMSVAIGHLHSFGGVQYSASQRDMIFGLNGGCLIDVEAYAFAYGEDYPNKPTIGCSVIKDGKYATFIPIEMSE